MMMMGSLGMGRDPSVQDSSPEQKGFVITAFTHNCMSDAASSEEKLAMVIKQGKAKGKGKGKGRDPGGN